MIMRSRLKSSGETSRSASLTSTKVEPQMAAVTISSRVALRVCFAMAVLLAYRVTTLGLPGYHVGEVGGVPCDHSAQHSGAKDIVLRDARQIAIEHDEVRGHAGCKRSFVR